MKRYVAKALRAAAKRAGISPKEAKRRIARLDPEQRRQYAAATFKRAFGESRDAKRAAKRRETFERDCVGLELPDQRVLAPGASMSPAAENSTAAPSILTRREPEE